MESKQISVKATAQNVRIEFNMHRDELETLRGILNLAANQLANYHNGQQGGIVSVEREIADRTDNLIAMIRGAILSY